MAIRLDFTIGGLRETIDTLRATPAMMTRAQNSALKSAGWLLQQEIKKQGQIAARGGYLNWRPRHPITPVIDRKPPQSTRVRREAGIKRARGRYSAIKYWRQVGEGATSSRPLARFVAAMRYRMESQSGRIVIGYLGGGFWEDILREHATGFAQGPHAGASNIHNDPDNVLRMRKYFAALGFPMRKGVSLRTPARPLVEPVYERNVEMLHKHMVLKFYERLSVYWARGEVY